MQTYLKRFYFDDTKLRQRTLLEFARWLQTGRMVAVVGSMASEQAGYRSWDELILHYLGTARDIVETVKGDSSVQAVKAEAGAIRDMLTWLDAKQKKRPEGQSFDGRVAMSVAREALKSIDGRRPIDAKAPADATPADAGKYTLESILEICVARRFRRRMGCDTTIVNELIDSLAINRLATLNYDLELELRLMAPWELRQQAKAPNGWIELYQEFETLLSHGRMQRDRGVRSSWTRTQGGGRRIVSDILDREHPDRLLEFAIGSTVVDQHIMHLHGRACTPSSMVLGLRDYDRMYRKTDMATLPFEFGRNLLFSGNPILFVGMGMTEQEVNSTLQHFVSNHPFRLITPNFLIWNTHEFPEDPGERKRLMAARRLDWLHRLGVMVIYDEDLGLTPLRPIPPTTFLTEVQKQEWEAQQRTQLLESLSQTIAKLADHATGITKKLQFEPDAWRGMAKRFEDAPQGASIRKARGPKRRIYRLWSREDEKRGQTAQPPLGKLLEDLGLSNGSSPAAPLRIVLGEPGSGRGAVARALLSEAVMPGSPSPSNEFGLLINAGFSFDTDSLLDGLFHFVLKVQNGEVSPLPPTARAEFLSNPENFLAKKTGDRRALVIINGVERFFSLDGRPLSVEFDNIFRAIAQTDASSSFHWVLMGTRRVERYFATIAPDANSTEMPPAPASSNGVIALPSAYFRDIQQAFEDKGMPLSKLPPAARYTIPPFSPGGHGALSKAFFRHYLDPEVLRAAGVTHAGLALDILRTLAFIGSPVEGVVLLHAPTIRARLRSLEGPAKMDGKALLGAAIGELKDLHLIVPMTPFEAYPDKSGLWGRFALHKALLSELRGRSGIPLSPAKRMTAFNLSLYVSQPLEGDRPRPTVHEELGDLIDHLIGSHKDLDVRTRRSSFSKAELEKAATNAKEFLPDALDGDSHHLLEPESVACLRAAFAVVRGYYSTSALLAVDPGQLDGAEDRDGALLEHADRLDRLLRGFRKMAALRQSIRGIVTEEQGKKLGPEPFYRDEIVWLHNEIGVVHLTMGDLYKAQFALDMAIKANKQIEFGSRGLNWRRITMNKVLLDIERGRLTDAEIKLNDIEAAVAVEPPYAKGQTKTSGGDDWLKGQKRIDYILDIYGGPDEPSRGGFDPQVTHEDLVMIALVEAFRALVSNLRGKYEEAELSYERSTRMLRRMLQRRAHAMFLRHYALLARAMQKRSLYARLLEEALAESRRGGQNDIAYQALMVQAIDQFHEAPASADKSTPGLADVQQAKDYSGLTDIYRLRVDAGARLARMKLTTGDAETALENATDALIYATSCGLSLRKIGLRLLIGQIYAARGDAKSGAAITDAAWEAAERIGYHPGNPRARFASLRDSSF